MSNKYNLTLDNLTYSLYCRSSEDVEFVLPHLVPNKNYADIAEGTNKLTPTSEILIKLYVTTDSASSPTLKFSGSDDNVKITTNGNFTLDPDTTIGIVLTTVNGGLDWAVNSQTAAAETAEDATNIAKEAQKEAKGATSTALEAKALATTATTDAQSAVQVANKAQQDSTSAKEAADAASTSAADAVLKAETAKSTADTAAKTASDATTIANQAQTVAQNAETAAENASTVAGEAKTAAGEAKTTAASAVESAATAINTANTANQAAGNAISTVNQLSTDVDAVKQKASELDTSLTAVKNDVVVVKQDVTSVTEKANQNASDIEEINTEMASVKETAEAAKKSADGSLKLTVGGPDIYQKLDTGVTLGSGRKFLVERHNGSAPLGFYVGQYNELTDKDTGVGLEQLEIGSPTLLMCLNHCGATFTDASGEEKVVDGHIRVDYRNNINDTVHQDQIAYMSDIAELKGMIKTLVAHIQKLEADASTDTSSLPQLPVIE